MNAKKTLSEKLHDLLSGNNTQEGYEQGFADGRKTARPADYRHIRPANFILHFGQAAKTYTEGYGAAYLDGKRVRHGVYSEQVSVNVSTDDVAAFANQLSRVRDEIYSQMTSLSTQFHALSNIWQDSQFERFSSTFTATEARLKSFLIEAESATQNLELYVEHLRDAASTQL